MKIDNIIRLYQSLAEWAAGEKNLKKLGRVRKGGLGKAVHQAVNIDTILTHRTLDYGRECR